MGLRRKAHECAGCRFGDGRLFEILSRQSCRSPSGPNRRPDGDPLSRTASALTAPGRNRLLPQRLVLAHKHAPAWSERNPLSGLVEIDEASLPFRPKTTSHRSARTRPRRVKSSSWRHELGDGNNPRRLRNWPKFLLRRRRPTDTSSKPPDPELRRRLVRLRCGPRRSPQCPWSGRPPLTWRRGPPRLLQPQRLGARRLHGLRRKHLQAHLDEFVFRPINPPRSFRSLFRLATNADPTYSVDRTGAMS